MTDFLKQLHAICRASPERPAIVDRDGERVTDYRTLDRLSGQVAAWLKEQGFGREDVIAILLPKGMEHIAVRIAVMKLGAAWVSLFDSMGPERVRSAMESCQCRLGFDRRCWEEATQAAPLDAASWADPDKHDLAFIIYTSGSTGTPKGAMQEYGIYERISAGTHRMLDAYVPNRFAHLIPEYFVGGVYITIGLLQNGGTIHVISSSLTHDLGAFFAYVRRHELNAAFTPPALGRVLLEQDLPLRVLFVGGEIVSRVWSERCDSLNIYGPSEFGHPTCICKIPSAMDNTPIGIPIAGTETLLLAEDGTEAESEGVLCVELPFFRGYVSAQDKVHRVALHGKSYYYSGDLARRAPDGSYTILGRVDSMVNINGNRVDPSEVEAALKKALGRPHASVKVFEQDGKPWLCAFYEGEAVEPAALTERLRAFLPTYMLPSRFVRLDSFPINSAGKVDYERLCLPESRFAPYVSPVSAEEKALCAAMARILETGGQPVGLDDDFFALGGDSLTAMRLLLEAGIPGLDMALLYRRRTVREIGKALREDSVFEPAPLSSQALSFPILPIQRLYVRGEKLLEKSIAAELRFSPAVTAERLTNALSAALNAHRALWTVMLPSGGGCVQCIGEAPPVLHLSGGKDGFLRPFRADGNPLLRARLLPSEQGCTLRLNVHHSVCDGSSFALFVKDILAACAGELPAADDYPVYLLKQQHAVNPARREREWALLQKRLGDTPWRTLPSPDLPGDADSRAAILERIVGIRPEALNATARRFRVSVSAFLTGTSLLSLGLFEGASDLLITWTWNGRADRESMRRVGLLLRDFPVTQHLDDAKMLGTLMAETAMQRDRGIAEDSTVFLGDPSDRAAERFPSSALCFTYHDYLPQLQAEALLTGFGQIGSPASQAEEPLELHLWDEGADYLAVLQYDASLYTPDRMDAFLRLYCDLLRHLCTCQNPEESLNELKKALPFN